MSDETTEPGAGDVEALADSIAGCFSNVSDLPEWMRAHALGRYMRPLVEIAARAVLASDWLAAHDAEVRRETGERIAQAIQAVAPPVTATGEQATRAALLLAAGIAREEASRG